MINLSIQSTIEQAEWYSRHYQEHGFQETPKEEFTKHMDRFNLPTDRKLSLLDIGCGDGSFVSLADERVDAIGVDISSFAIDMAKINNPPGGKFLLMSPEDLSYFPDDSFHFVTSLGSIEHVIDIDKALDEIYRVLHPDGRWYFYVPNELWTRLEHPNERALSDTDWISLFIRHKLRPTSWDRIDDRTAIQGDIHGNGK